MKKFVSVLTAALLALFTGCVTKVHEIQLTGNVQVDAPRAIAEGPARDKVLWEYRLASADLRHDNFADAKANLDDALARLGGIYGKDADAKKARSYFNSENKKTFIGEPYERVMAYYYRGILYWMDGEPDNARACFRSGQIEDSSSEGEQYTADYVILDYLDGFASAKLGDDGSDAFNRAEKLATHFAKPPAYNTNANVLFFVEYGTGPRKYAGGQYHDELHFITPETPVYSMIVHLDGQSVAAGPYDDLGFQATTRGGRVMDHVLGNKAVFKTTTGAVGDVAIAGGAATAIAGHSGTTSEIGLGLVAAGLISKAVSASTRPEADIRSWNNLPRYLTFAALQVPAGPHVATVEFYDRFGQLLSYLTKTINLQVSADKHDKVVFVSDASINPQNL